VGVTAAAAALGLVLLAGALGLFRRTGQDPKPWKSTPEIIATGVYRFTRNPMYLGMALLQAAIGVGWANGWILALVPAVLAVVYATAIRHEEAYLERKFGDAYLHYKRSVRRWI
jgi:protein-S-isoprenylcysteine O-methyltransferase Ste14